MKRLTIGLSLGVLALGHVAHAVERISVTAFSEPPKYSLTTDASDKSQLTDGAILPHPLWRFRQAVGWAYEPRVAITIQQAATATGSGTLRIHTGKGIGGAVYVPGRIDVYAIDSPTEFAHIGQFQKPQESFANQSSHWLDIPIARRAKNMMIVVHAGGTYIMMDEIQLLAGAPAGAALPGATPPIASQSLAIADSTKRLTSASQAASSAKVGQLIEALPQTGTNALTAWSIPPYVPDLNQYTLDNAATIDRSVEVKGAKWEKESFVVGVANHGSTTLPVTLSVSPAAPFVQVKLMDKVVAANGTQVYDPLLPISDNKVSLGGNKALYLWVDVDLSKAPLGTTSYRLNMNGGTNASAQIALKVISQNIASPATPVRANPWAYYTDKPIWNLPSANFSDLSSHRANVHVMNDMPPVGATALKTKYKMMQVINEIKIVRGKSEILLFMGWPWRLDKDGLNDLPDSKLKPLITNHLKLMVNELRAAGIGYDEWALYPVDEAHNEKMVTLRRVLPWIRSADPQIRVYANPTKSSNRAGELADLKFIQPYISIWQPHLDFARTHQSFFASQGKEWWIYYNPRQPVKAYPSMHYRGIGWNAWEVGASGSGCWAYSTTEKTSAWSDTDGARPDWAMVYESPTGPVSSRRWEAFRDGVEDFELLRAAIREKRMTTVLSDSIKDQVSSVQVMAPEVVDQMRAKLLALWP